MRACRIYSRDFGSPGNQVWRLRRYRFPSSYLSVSLKLSSLSLSLEKWEMGNMFLIGILTFSQYRPTADHHETVTKLTNNDNKYTSYYIWKTELRNYIFVPFWSLEKRKKTHTHQDHSRLEKTCARSLQPKKPLPWLWMIQLYRFVVFRKSKDLGESWQHAILVFSLSVSSPVKATFAFSNFFRAPRGKRSLLTVESTSRKSLSPGKK